MSNYDIISSQDVSLVTITNLPSDLVSVSDVLKAFYDAEINIDMISLSPPRSEDYDFSFTANDAQMSEILKCTTAIKAKSGNIKVLVSFGYTKIVVSSEKLRYTPGEAHKIFKILSDNKIDLNLITSSETEVSILIHESHSDLAIDSLNAKLNG